MVPEAQTSNGHDMVIGKRDVNGNGHLTFINTVLKRFRLLERVKHVQTMYTWRQDTITQIHVEDVTMHVTGSRDEVISSGPGFTNITLKFINKWNCGFRKYVILYGHH